ncbi:Mitochondrial metalloendopeptidase OMA1 [Madurella mycetomatis]|uniref:Mitochondrial metalloendopeptidase OMA1 n=1 Tax=Madurella mycetomatis TaxID=100816 RepID=A0A175WDD1_9PEZI|nr:Mitochondrial metalloendopeptidase OMA1 [Madurella mycetomatis]
MSSFLRARPLVAQGRAIFLRCPSSGPSESFFRTAAARNLSLPRQQPQKCGPSRLPARPAPSRHRPATSPLHQNHQPRYYRQHPGSSGGGGGGSNNYNPYPSSSSYYHPETQASRLATAKPLLTPRGLNSPSTYTIIAVAFAAGLIFYFSNLETVPVSGRTRFNVYGAESVRKAGEMEHARLLYELQARGVRMLPDWDPRTARVKRVMARLLPFSGMSGEGDEWEVFVVDDDRTANAFVLPGGKVFVFSGILPLARNDSGLATVLGHEIAHNLAGHVAERLSQDIGASIVLYSLVILGGVFGLGPLIMHFFGGRFLDVAFGFPMSRLQESEADYIGLMMMAEACYDPSEAVGFWARMERATAGQEVPEWMSTHPTNVSRIKKIQDWLPEAMEKRALSDCRTTTAFADLFKRAMERGQVVILG